jgi:hypothetical protein
MAAALRGAGGRAVLRIVRGAGHRDVDSNQIKPTMLFLRRYGIQTAR